MTTRVDKKERKENGEWVGGGEGEGYFQNTFEKMKGTRSDWGENRAYRHWGYG